jgi:hypothetical protein
VNDPATTVSASILTAIILCGAGRGPSAGYHAVHTLLSRPDERPTASGEPDPTHPTYPLYLTSIAIAAAAALLVVGVRWGTFAAGGSDSACYLNQARLFRLGTTHIEEPLIDTAPWPRAEWTFTPAGHIPSPIRRDEIVPICPPGLPLTMALTSIVPRGEFYVVPICGALAVWLTFVLGRRLESAAVGAAAAVLLACSPSVLFQVVQPMTDVPAMAWWLLAAAFAIGFREGRARPLAAGVAASMAVLTRPNLAPLAALVALYVASSFRRTVAGPAEAGLHTGPAKAGLYVLGLIPGVVVLAVLQYTMYGSPLATGYGAPGELFKTANIAPNMTRYTRWLFETHTPVLAFAFAAPFVARRKREAWFGLGIALVTLALYLPYIVFGDWTYVRFLLPGLPWLIVLTSIVVTRVGRRVAGDRTAPLLALVVVGVGAFWMHVARERSAFDLIHLERHFVDAGTFVAQRLADRTAILTVRHSGSVHYYSHRPTVSWDTLEPDALDTALAFLQAQGLRPMLLLDTAEEPVFRARFERASPIGHLDWPPLASVGRTIRVYDPSDRARYFAR